jgi:tRNA G18 (ribose-2'-O)-methylase SpoU
VGWAAILQPVQFRDLIAVLVEASSRYLVAQLEAGADVQATIPLAPGAESLNVAVTASIALYEWRRRARGPHVES